MSSQLATGQEQSRCRCEYTGGYGIENDSGFGNGNVGVMGKSKETAGLEVETMAGTESGADTAAGMDLESRVDRSGAVAGPEVSARCAIATGGGDAEADMCLTVAGTATGDEAAVVAKVRVGPIAEMIPSACVVASKSVVPANPQLGIGGTEMERVG